MFDVFIRDFARWTPRASAVVIPDRFISYGEFDADIDRCGGALTALGVTPASGVVAVSIRSAYLCYVVTCALARLGVTSAPYDDHDADLRLTDGVEDLPGPVIRLPRAWIDAMFAAEPRPLPILDLDPMALGRVMLSSGTTRAPRRIGMGWRRLETGSHATLRTYCAGRSGTWVTTAGIDSMMGLSLAITAWSVGAAFTGALRPEELPGWLEVLPPGMLAMTPVQLRQLLGVLPANFQPQPAWRIVCGGSLLPPATAREARLRLTPDVRVIFGGTEAGYCGVCMAADLETFPGTVGYVAAGAVVEIVDDRGRPMPDGISGEFRIRGSRTAAAYIGDPAATAERFRDGWFYTNDIGRRLPDGRLIYEGRADDSMNLGGRKFMPSILEEAALECRGILDAAAFAAPDAKGMDQCWLAIATAEGFDRERLAPHLAGYPDLPPPRFAWIDAIPRNDMGKIERRKLRDMLMSALST